jgi:hypothetical protein
MDVCRGLLRHLKTLGSKSCLFRSMVLGLIVSYLAVFPGCAAEGDVESGPSAADPTMQVNATTDVSLAPLQEGSESGSPNVDLPMPINAAEASTSVPVGDFQSELSQAIPMMPVNSPDASTSTPEGDSGLRNVDLPMPINAAEASGMTSEEGHGWGGLALVLGPFNSSGDDEAPEAHTVNQPGEGLDK